MTGVHPDSESRCKCTYLKQLKLHPNSNHYFQPSIYILIFYKIHVEPSMDAALTFSIMDSVPLRLLNPCPPHPAPLRHFNSTHHFRCIQSHQVHTNHNILAFLPRTSMFGNNFPIQWLQKESRGVLMACLTGLRRPAKAMGTTLLSIRSK